MFRRILVAVDSRPDDRVITGVAAGLAQTMRGRVRGCYVIDRALIGAAPVVYRERLRAELRREGTATLREVRAVCRSVKVPSSGVVVEGDVARAILGAARRFGADLIVLGTRGPGRVGLLLGGSVAVDLVSRTTCPVLLVRHGTALPSRARRPGRRIRS